MAVKIEIRNVHPQADGEYDLDLPFSLAENHKVKMISGIRPNEVGDALASGDTDLYVAWASVALERHGKDIPLHTLWGGKGGNAETLSIRVIITEDEEPADPNSTPSEPPAAELSGSDDSGRAGTTSELPASAPSPTGSPASDIGPESKSGTSAG